MTRRELTLTNPSTGPVCKLVVHTRMLAMHRVCSDNPRQPPFDSAWETQQTTLARPKQTLAGSQRKA
eukprot:scaffold224943_cov30-Tisochrysis_lutea.AAC.2